MPTYDLRLQRAPLLIFLVVVVVVVVVATTPNYLRQASQNLGKYYTTLCQATNQPPWQTPNRSWLPTVWLGLGLGLGLGFGFGFGFGLGLG